MPVPQTLKIKANDSKQLHVIASLLQDALIMPRDVAFDAAAQRFVLIANRFMWEREPEQIAGGAPVAQDSTQDSTQDASFDSVDPRFDASSLLWRVHAALRFEGVQAVSRRNWPQDDSQPLALLSITPDATPQHYLLIFSGQAAVRLSTRALSCALEDISEPWPTQARPAHKD